MSEKNTAGAFLLGLFVCVGLLGLGYVLGSSAIQFKEYERTVTVKGLSEREAHSCSPHCCRCPWRGHRSPVS